MATKILPVSKSKALDYADESLKNFWYLKKNIKAQDHRDAITNIIQSAQEGFVCIQTESLTDKDLIKRIFDAAQRQMRFYILANEYSQELDVLNELCLIRYEVQNIGSLILVNPNSKQSEGVFFTGRLTEQSIAVKGHISQNLEATEIKDLFPHFCYQFWELAKKEVVEKGKHNEIISKPIDVFHDVNAFNGKDFVYGTVFNFAENAKRGSFSDRQIIYLNREKQIPVLIKPNITIELGENTISELLPKNEFENLEPNFQDDEVSIRIEYKWLNVPFYLPEKASESTLYERWKKKQEEIVKQLDSILVKIEDAEKRKETISKRITRLFLGKTTVFNDLRNEIDELKQSLNDFPNLSESKLKEKINRINEINATIQKQIGEIETEDRKAKIDEEIEKLKSDIDEKQKELELKKEELEKQNKEKEEKLDAFCQNYGIEKNELYKKRSIWEQQAGKKNMEKNPEEAKIAQEKLDELNKISNKVFISKAEDEIVKMEKEIRTLQGKIDNKEKEKSKTIEQSDTSSLSELLNNKSSKDDNSTKTHIIQMPDPQTYPRLPQVGKLFQLNSQPYLVIHYWEDYEQAKIEAERLKAKLCTIKN